MSQLPPIITPDLLTQIRTHPLLRPKTWDIISAVTLSILNRPDEIPKIYTTSLSTLPPLSDEVQEHAEKLQLTRRMREALLKVAAVGGFPKTINALMELKSCTSPALLDAASSSSASPTSRTSELRSNPSAILSRGKAFFDAVYGKVAGRVMKQLDECGAEDLGAVVRLVYGHILSDEAVLGKAETSFCMIAGLIPQDVGYCGLLEIWK